MIPESSIVSLTPSCKPRASGDDPTEAAVMAVLPE